jgi:crotonobetaine/carnitine-CoA ligase
MTSTLTTPLQMICDGARLYPERDVLTFVDIKPAGNLVEEIRTYRDLFENGHAVAAALIGECMKRDHALAVIMNNHPEFVDTMIGSEIAGTILVPIDPRIRGQKLAFMLDYADCRGAFVADYALPHILEVLPNLPKLKWIWVLGAKECPTVPGVRISSFADVIARSDKTPGLPSPDLTRPMQLLFTSGTSGDPKAVVSPYGRFAFISSLGEGIGFRSDDRPYTGLSLTHANAQLISLGNSLKHGLRLVISRRFTKGRLWEILHRYDCTTFSLLGGMAIAIYAEPPGAYDRNHNVRQILSAGMPPALWRQFTERFGVEIFEFYGAVEGGLTLNPPGVGPVGSVGKPPTDLICGILDENDNPCGPGVIGEMCFRPITGEAPPVTYFKNPEASAAKVHDGWLRSGDAGYKDDDGWVYFAHRMSSSIRRNGDFVSAAEIEAHIASLDDVADVHVYGLATPSNAPGEKEVIAAVVPRSDVSFDPCVVFTQCRDRIGPSSMPSFIQLVDEIPKTASEKPQSRFLVQMLSDGRSKLYDRSGGVVTLALAE